MSPPPSPSPSPDAARTRGGAASTRPSAIPLHKVARSWLDQCVNGSSIEAALPSSEYWRQRRHYAFYKHLHCVLQRYAGTARSALDVGSALPPYLNALPWIASRTIVGPRFAGNVGRGGVEILSLRRIAEKFGVVAIQADFLEWQLPEAPLATGGSAPGRAVAAAPQAQPFDLVLCSEVVEHVPQPRAFVRKLLSAGKVLVLSVPYRWAPCDDTKCHHVSNQITRDMIAGWAGRQPDAFDVVQETSGEQRIICVYRAPH